MLAGIIAFITKLLDVCFPAKSAEKVARDDGTVSGIAQQEAADQAAVIKDVQDAKAASDSVDRGLYSGLSVSKSDGFRRD